MPKIGPWGGPGGTERDIAIKPGRLLSVTIRSGYCIDAISFTYLGHNCEEHSMGPWGGTGGYEHKIVLDDEDYVKEISGTVGKYNGHVVVTSLTFVTSKGNPSKYGPYGSVDGTPFNIPVLEGGQVAGFFGRSDEFLNAIGLYIN